MQIYDISECQIKAANKKFSSLQNEYELFMSERTVVTWVPGAEAEAAIPATSYNFLTIDQLLNKQKDDLVGEASFSPGWEGRE